MPELPRTIWFVNYIGWHADPMPLPLIDETETHYITAPGYLGGPHEKGHRWFKWFETKEEAVKYLADWLRKRQAALHDEQVSVAKRLDEFEHRHGLQPEDNLPFYLTRGKRVLDLVKHLYASEGELADIRDLLADMMHVLNHMNEDVYDTFHGVWHNIYETEQAEEEGASAVTIAVTYYLDPPFAGDLSIDDKEEITDHLVSYLGDTDEFTIQSSHVEVKIY